jgi:hypothetical protein
MESLWDPGSQALLGFEGESPGFGQIADVVVGFMAKAGFERDYGRRVVSDLEAAGLTDIRGEGRAPPGCCRPRKPRPLQEDSTGAAGCSRR